MNTLNVAFGAQIAVAAERHHLDPRLLAAVAAQETGGPGSDSGRNIIGDGGHGRGVFQIDDRWHPFAGSPAAMNPGANAEYASGLIAGLLAKNGGDVHAALSAYNAGSAKAAGTKTTWGDGATLGYADSVLRHFERLGGPTRPTALGASRDTQLAALPDLVAQTDALRALFSRAGRSNHTYPALAARFHTHSDPQPNAGASAAILAPSDDDDPPGDTVL